MTEETIEIRVADGTRLHVVEYIGQGNADVPLIDVVLLHGWPGSGRVWRWLAKSLLLAGGCRQIAPDFRGFGDSDKPAHGCPCDTFADDIQNLIETLGLTHYILVGHSMGGKIAQMVAARQLKGLMGLVLVAPSPLESALESGEPEQRAAYSDPSLRRALLTKPAARPLPEEVVTLLLEDAAKASQEAWFGWMDMRKENHSGAAANIMVPTLVIGGEKDANRDPDTLKRDTVSRINGAKLVTIPRIGHLVHLEDPTVLAVLIRNFLETMKAPANVSM